MLRTRWWTIALALGVGVLLATDRVLAEEDAEARPVVIHGGTILTMGPAGEIKAGTLSIRKGKIGRVGPGGRPGMPNPRQVRIDATGMYVTPGLIDAWTNLAMAAGGRPGSATASHRAIDGLNGYDRHVLEQALRQGVTAITLEPAARQGIVGTAALVRLADLDEIGGAATTDVCLVARLGVGKGGPFGRLNELKALRKAFKEAKTYREAWEDYEEELEEYVKDLEAGKKVKLDKKEKKAKKDKPKQRRGRRKRPRDASGEALMAWLVDLGLGTGNEGDNPQLRGEFAGEKKPSAKKKGDSKAKEEDDEIEKPKRPGKDRNKEVLVRALKRELPVRFEAHRPADILNVLELAAEFNLDATIEGASGGRYVAEDLADAEVPVVLGRMIRTGLFDNSHYRDHDVENAGRLWDAGVEVSIGSGPGGRGSATHYLRQNAAIAAGNGLNAEEALKAVTINAAKVCGVADSIGSLEPGKTADVVIWRGHPLASESVVEYVFVGGKEVYRRKK